MCRLSFQQQMNTAISLSDMLHRPTSSISSKNPADYKCKPLNAFYSHMLSVWSHLRCFQPVDESEVRRDPVWSNSQITWNVPPLKKKAWEDAGISLLAGICKECEGRRMSHEEINAKFGLTSSFLDVLGRLAIPLHWRIYISSEWHGDPPNSQELYVKLGEGESFKLTSLSS